MTSETSAAPGPDARQGHARVVLPSAQPIYAAAARWRDEALIEDRSLFSGKSLDVTVAIAGLLRHFVGNLEEGSGTFLGKLKHQMQAAEPEAVQVAAELLYIHSLVVATEGTRSRTKSQLIDGVLAIRPDETAPVPVDLLEALRSGVARPGQAYNSLRWKMFRYLIWVYEAVKALEPGARRVALTSLEEFRALLAPLDEQSVWSQRFALEHLLFPDVCPAILSRDDRHTILSSLGQPGEQIEQLVARLEPNVEYGDQRAVNLYRTPYRQRWHGRSSKVETYLEWAARVQRSVNLDTLERNDKLETAQTLRSAIDAARSGGDPLQELRRGLQGSNLVDFRVTDDFLRWAGEHREKLGEALVELATHPGPESIDRFLRFPPREDQLSGVGARLSLASTLLMSVDPERFPPWRDTPWKVTQRLTDGRSPQEAATCGEYYVLFLERLDLIALDAGASNLIVRDRLDAQGVAWAVASYNKDLLGWQEDQYRDFDAWRSGREPVLEPSKRTEHTEHTEHTESHSEDHPADPVPETLEELAAELWFSDDDVDWLEETVDLVKTKRQLILQGPPGTGKTYIGRAIARFLTGSNERVEMVQFHPTYSYEDFIAGIRPDPANPTAFIVVQGPLLRVAETARADPESTYVLFIDEINRANIPAVFGELYFLLEYRGQAARMTYGGAPFALPENLLLIGTMNTADRSITALDSAMRRRFFIRDLRPAEKPLAGSLRGYLTAKAPSLLWLVDLLDLANERIDDADQAIGPSHFMGEISEQSARRAWDNAVLPGLRELFYHQQARLADLDFDLLRAEVGEGEVGAASAES